jgi:tyrosine-protein phosphatase SIW14
MDFAGRLSRMYAAPAVMLAVLSGVSAAAQPAIAGELASGAGAATRLSTIGIDNFGQVSSGYYRGAQPKGSDYADLAALGVKTVIDLTKDGDPQELSLAQAAGMRFYRIPMTTRETPSAEKVAQFLKLVDDPANQPVYVHCQGGRHRTGVMTAIHRMSNDHWTADQAFAEMKKYKYGPDFLHPEFKQFVYSYEPQVQAIAAPTIAASSNATPSSAATR